MTRTVPFDPTALTEPVSRADVRAFTAQLRREGTLGSRVVSIVVLALVGGAILLIGVPVFVTALGALFSRDGDNPLAFLFIVFFCGAAVLVGWVIVRASLGTAARRYRLDRFARANGMTWHPERDDPALPGMIFSVGHSREATDLVRGTDPRFVEIANYRYKTGSGKNEQTHRWAYVAIRLDTPLPHIVLDATGNNGLFGSSNLPMAFGRDQRLSLEGDFDRHFALYCPQGYERDALYLFTPDVMARFIDNAAQLDVEIIDDWLFLYARRDLSTLDPATWQWVFTTIVAVDEKLAQWARWRDDRLAGVSAAAGAVASGNSADAAPMLTPPPAGVAPQGRRLKRSFSWVTVVAVVLGIGFWVLTFVR